MAENQLFRKSAIEKLASPERLDVLMQVTSPVGWVAIGTVAFILACAIVWSVVGSIPTRIDGQGILLRGGEASRCGQQCAERQAGTDQTSEGS